MLFDYADVLIASLDIERGLMVSLNTDYGLKPSFVERKTNKNEYYEFVFSIKDDEHNKTDVLITICNRILETKYQITCGISKYQSDKYRIRISADDIRNYLQRQIETTPSLNNDFDVSKAIYCTMKERGLKVLQSTIDNISEELEVRFGRTSLTEHKTIINWEYDAYNVMGYFTDDELNILISICNDVLNRHLVTIRRKADFHISGSGKISCTVTIEELTKMGNVSSRQFRKQEGTKSNLSETLDKIINMWEKYSGKLFEICLIWYCAFGAIALISKDNRFNVIGIWGYAFGWSQAIVYLVSTFRRLKKETKNTIPIVMLKLAFLIALTLILGVQLNKFLAMRA